MPKCSDCHGECEHYSDFFCPSCEMSPDQIADDRDAARAELAAAKNDLRREELARESAVRQLTDRAENAEAAFSANQSHLLATWSALTDEPHDMPRLVEVARSLRARLAATSGILRDIRDDYSDEEWEAARPTSRSGGGLAISGNCLGRIDEALAAARSGDGREDGDGE